MSDEAAAEFEAVRERLRQVDMQLAGLEQELAEVQRAQRTLEGLGDHAALLPIGAGLHVRATLQGAAPVLVPIGAGYAADRDVETARTGLATRAEQLQQLLRRVEQEAETLAGLADSLLRKLQSAPT